MASQSKPLAARSVQEEDLYLLVQSCQKCQSGPLEEVSRRQSSRPEGRIDDIQAHCSACGEETTLQFLRPTQVKTTAHSEIIDVGEWLALCHHFLDLGQTNSDKQQTEQQIRLARFCLSEALKFYPKDSDLPAPSAFFGHLGNQRFKEHPATFLKPKLLELRRQMLAPSGGVSEYKSTDAQKKRKWWRSKS